LSGPAKKKQKDEGKTKTTVRSETYTEKGFQEPALEMGGTCYASEVTHSGRREVKAFSESRGQGEQKRGRRSGEHHRSPLGYR